MNIGIPVTADRFTDFIMLGSMILIVFVMALMVYVGLFETVYPEHNFFVIWIGFIVILPLALWLLSMGCEIFLGKGFLNFHWREDK